VIELYAITDNPGPPLPDVAPLRTIPVDGLAAGCAPAVETEASPETLWRHEEVVEALMADRDLLPARYGTRLEDETAVVRAVEDRRDELTVALDRVRGAVEVSVRVATLGAPPDSVAQREAGSGAEYLRERARAEVSSERAADTVHEPLSALSRASVVGRPRPPELFRAAYLVERAVLGTFAATVARLQDASPGFSILCTGPWPPYSFAER
jgi:hypothetical protein